MSVESRSTFFKQSSWLVIATTLSGVFLIGVYPVLNNRIPDTEVGVFLSMLRLFTVLAIPAAGLQAVMAQEAAAAITDERHRQLAVNTRAVVQALFLIWVVLVVVCAIRQPQITAALKIANPATLWITLGLVLAALLLPIAQGLLQGFQNFPWLAGSILLNGVGRFFSICLCVFLFKAHSAGALFGAFLGVAAAVAIGAYPVRHVLRPAPGRFDWKQWATRLLPLTGGSGAMIFIINADVLFVQTRFPAEVSVFYSAVAVLGVGLVAFTGPMAAVMFPKIVRSRAQLQQSNSLTLALVGAGSLAAFGALVCTVIPSLPLRIIHFNKPDLWVSSQLVPWFMWAMLPVTLANVLINNLLAQGRFRSVPFLVVVAIAYGVSLHTYLNASMALPHFETFKGVILRLGIFSSLLLFVSIVFTFLRNKR